MLTGTRPKPAKKSTTKSVKIDSSTNGKIQNQESLLSNALSGMQNDIRELRTDIKKLDEKINDKIDKLDERINDKVDKLDERINSNFKWVLGIMTTFLTIIFAVVFFLHNDLKGNMRDLKGDVRDLKADVKENRDSIKQINQKLDRLLSK